jgi:hypothetical protein
MIDVSVATVAAASGVAVAVGAAVEHAVNNRLRRIRVINNLDFISFTSANFLTLIIRVSSENPLANGGVSH